MLRPVDAAYAGVQRFLGGGRKAFEGQQDAARNARPETGPVGKREIPAKAHPRIAAAQVLGAEFDQLAVQQRNQIPGCRGEKGDAFAGNLAAEAGKTLSFLKNCALVQKNAAPTVLKY